jgi:hypothetical protein
LPDCPPGYATVYLIIILLPVSRHTSYASYTVTCSAIFVTAPTFAAPLTTASYATDIKALSRDQCGDVLHAVQPASDLPSGWGPICYVNGDDDVRCTTMQCNELIQLLPHDFGE